MNSNCSFQSVSHFSISLLHPFPKLCRMCHQLLFLCCCLNSGCHLFLCILAQLCLLSMHVAFYLFKIFSLLNHTTDQFLLHLDFHNSAGTPSGPTAFPLFILPSASLTSPLETSGTIFSFGVPSSNTVLWLSSFNGSSKYSCHFSKILLQFLSTFLSPSLICLMSVKSFVALLSVLAIFKSSSVFLVCPTLCIYCQRPLSLLVS